MAECDVTLPPCGHTDRLRQLTEISIRATTDQILHFLVCSVPSCPEFCRVFADLRDPCESDVEDAGMNRPTDDASESAKTMGEPAFADAAGPTTVQ